MSEQIWIIIGGIVTAVTSYLVGREKMKSDIKKDNTSAQREEIETVKEAILIWKGMAETFKNEVEVLAVEVDKLKQENQKLHKDLELMREENIELRKEVNNLRNIVNHKNSQ